MYSVRAKPAFSATAPNGSPVAYAETAPAYSAAGMSGGFISTIWTSLGAMPCCFRRRRTNR